MEDSATDLDGGEKGPICVKVLNQAIKDLAVNLQSSIESSGLETTSTNQHHDEEGLIHDKDRTRHEKHGHLKPPHIRSSNFLTSQYP